MNHGSRKYNRDKNVLALSGPSNTDVLRVVYKYGALSYRVYVLLVHSWRGHYNVYVSLLMLLYERDTQVAASRDCHNFAGQYPTTYPHIYSS